MDRYDSTRLPLSPSIRAGEFSSADLIFYGVKHGGPSFKALVFFNAEGADLATPLELESGYAGSFTVFGHGGCFGDEGHCHVPEGAVDPFDSRPLHPLTPLTKSVDVSDGLRRATDGEYLSVTVLPVVPQPEDAGLGDVLHFEAMRLAAYD
jgi:tyrosinase